MKPVKDFGYYSLYYRGHRIDPYRIMDVYRVVHPCHQHALKKLLRAGTGHKPLDQDIDETIATLERWKRMREEDSEIPD